MLTPAHVILELNKVKEELDQLKAELEHEKRDRKIIVSCLESELSTLRGPKCPDENCLDYDGEHPYHNNVRVQAWEKAQKELVRPLQEQLAILTAQLAEADVDITKLKAELAEAKAASTRVYLTGQIFAGMSKSLGVDAEYAEVVHQADVIEAAIGMADATIEKLKGGK